MKQSYKAVIGATVLLTAFFGIPSISLAQDKSEASVSNLPATGTVTDATTGKPLPGATVFVYTARVRTGTSPFCPSCYADCGKRAAADKTGSFRIPSLATSLIFRFLVVRDGYDSTFVDEVDVLKKRPITASLKPRPVPTPAEKARTVFGRILDEQGGPVVGASVEAQGFVRGDFKQVGNVSGEGIDELAITDSAGNFSIRCGKENTTINVLVKARNLAPYTSFSLKTSADVAANTLRIPVGVTVRGQLKTTDGDKPVAEAVAQLVPIDRESERFTGWHEIGTDSTGKFEFSNIPPDKDYLLCVRMDSLAGRKLTVNSQRIHVGKNGSILEGLPLVARPAQPAEGRLSLVPPMPIPPKTRVMVGRTDTWDVQFAEVDTSGVFRVEGMPETDNLELSVQVPGYHLARNPQRDPFNVHVPAGHTGPILIALEKDIEPIRFHIAAPRGVSLGDGLPVSWTQGADLSSESVWVDGNGDFSIPNIPPGVVLHLQIYSDNFRWKKPDSNNQRTITLTTPEVTDRATPFTFDVLPSEKKP